MKIAGEINSNDTLEALRFLHKLLGAEKLHRKWDELTSFVEKNLWRNHVLNTCGLEIAHRDADHWMAENSRLPSPTENVLYYRLYTFAVFIHRLFLQSSTPIQRRIHGNLRKHYFGLDGLRPLAYEYSIAAHLSRCGFDLYFHDLEGGGGYDFLATDEEGVGVEIECKHVSADIGRKIHREKFLRLLDYIDSTLKYLLANSFKDHVVEIEIEDRLESDVQTLRMIDNSIRETVTGSTKNLNQEDVKISILSEKGGASSGENFNRARFGTQENNLVVVVKSRKPDQVWEKITKTLRRDAKRQFSFTKPAIMMVEISDLTSDQLIRLEKEQATDITTLQHLAGALFENRKALSALSLSTRGHLEQDHDYREHAVVERGASMNFFQIASGEYGYEAVKRALPPRRNL